jgi:thiamine-phosphate pyrophosphorylase
VNPGDSLAERLAVIVITDPDCGAGRDVVAVVRAALRGGVGAVQLRAKHESTRDQVELGRLLRIATSEAGALLFVNDRTDVALAIGADGVHVGDDDLPLRAVRAIVPAGFIVGRSVDTAEEATTAEEEGADYVGAGPVLGTPSKLDAAPPIGVTGIQRIAGSTTLPVIAIGGIDVTNAAEIARAGASGIAVIRALMLAPDAEAAACELVRAVARGRQL